ncbi:hypothetical protein [Sphingomonas fennica]|uniref:DUF4440 domain-containing protein n=1 Tax=Edaphosphingomonas fennica TaxID=114404 RepID=A0A2T4HWP4_9SPHN|nr:hypothetical protein [Sphingomonas fennica]PTD20254.1 hypothetical protein CV103_11770 [Sphingomonas fennica]
MADRPHSAPPDSEGQAPWDHVVRMWDLAVARQASAVEGALYEADVEADGGPACIAGRWTEIYRRTDDGWRMLSVSGGPDGER